MFELFDDSEFRVGRIDSTDYHLVERDAEGYYHAYINHDALAGIAGGEFEFYGSDTNVEDLEIAVGNFIKSAQLVRNQQ